MPQGKLVSKGLIEHIGEAGSKVKDHYSGLQMILAKHNHVQAVGHRVVHGAEEFREPAIIDNTVIRKIRQCCLLAPLHNPANLTGILACKKLLPGIKQVAVFDTAFHQSLPDYAYIYGLPYAYYLKFGIRKYGFHGTSHQYVAYEAAHLLKKPLHKLKIITCHLGNGCSITAINKGKSVDTSMGFTPLEGLVMGTRCGDTDPALITHIMHKKKFDTKQMDRILNKESGLKGISGISNDVRLLEEKAKAGNQRDLDKIVNKYAYLGGYSVNDNVWTKKDILIQVGSLKNPLEKMKMARAARRKNKIAQQKLIIKLASRDKMLAKAAQAINLYVWLRTERVDSYKETMFFIRPFYRRLEKDFSWKFGWAGNLSYDEIVNILKKGQAPLAAELEKRNRLQYLAHITKQKTIIIADVNRRNRYLNILMGKSRQTDVKLIKGQIAYPGIVRGKVRIILDASKARLVKKNEILVANMTHPDYLVGIRKAAAIVTDEGGILCHASIISRELKIPCIIGTKIATKVLHDGNLVEVDADKGIVKKIK